MAAVGQPLPETTRAEAPSEAGAAFAAAVRDARSDIEASVERGGLQRDPLRYPLGALSAAIGLFPEMLARMEAVVDRGRTPSAEDERRAAEAMADAIARLDQRLAARAARRDRAAVVLSALLAALLAGGVLGGGYWCGYRAAEGRLVPVPAALGEALTGRDAAAWLGLIRNNDIARVRRTCAVENGRAACSFALWTEPPPRGREAP